VSAPARSQVDPCDFAERRKPDVSESVLGGDPFRELARGGVERSDDTSPAYLAQRGRPARPQDLKGHDCLAFIPGTTDAAPATWKLRSDTGKALAVRVCGSLQTNNTFALHEAALAGLGIADLPIYLVTDDLRAGRLETVLDHFVAPDRSVYAVYAPGGSVPARVRELVRFLALQFADSKAEETAPHARLARRHK
jgi:DNA-binding transcriptional LysR family regulator